MNRNLSYGLGSVKGTQLQTLSEIKSALAKAIFNHPSVAEVISQDNELKHLQNIFLEADLTGHYLQHDITPAG